MDAYRILGVSRSADEVVIRAAYLALMKRYHPDQPGADPERAKAVAAAYRLVGDPGRRAAYDREETARAYAGLGGEALPAEPPRRTGRAAFFLISAATLGLAYVAVTRPLPHPLPSAIEAPPKVAAEEASSEVVQEAEGEPPPVAPEPRTRDLPEVVLPEIEALPGPAPETRTAMATRPRNDEVAAPAPPAREASAPAPAAGAPAREALARQALARQAPARAAPAPRSEQLAALERHQTILYNQSFLAGDTGKRARLLETRAAFLRRLEGCGGNDCRRDVYLARNQEVAEIMSN